MTYMGHVRNGLIALNDAVVLPEGTAVRVEPIAEAISPEPGEKSDGAGLAEPDNQPTIGDMLRAFAGTVEGLPPDMAKNHNFYRRQQVLDRHDGTPDSSDQELTELLLRHAGKGVDLPSDLAANHDHYAHGKPKP